MIQFRQRIDLSWLGNNYYPPLWWRKWRPRMQTFINCLVLGFVAWKLFVWFMAH